MLKIMQLSSRWLAKNASLFIIAVAVFTFFLPDVFGWVREHADRHPWNDYADNGPHTDHQRF